jgi:hypothetical protein
MEISLTSEGTSFDSELKGLQVVSAEHGRGAKYFDALLTFSLPYKLHV